MDNHVLAPLNLFHVDFLLARVVLVQQIQGRKHIFTQLQRGVVHGVDPHPIHRIVARILIHFLIGFVHHHLHLEVLIAQQRIDARARTCIVFIVHTKLFGLLIHGGHGDIHHFFFAATHHKIIKLLDDRRRGVHHFGWRNHISRFERYLSERFPFRLRQRRGIVFQFHLNHILIQRIHHKILMDAGLKA